MLWWFDLDHTLNIWEIEAPGSHIGGNDDENPPLLEVIVDSFPLELPDITMKHFTSISLQLIIDFIDIFLSLTKDDTPSMLAHKATANLLHSCPDIVVGVDGISVMFDCLGN